MKQISNDILLKTLSFISDNNNKVSRYVFDKYITKTFLFDESFIIIPKYLFEEKLVEISKENDTTFIILSNNGFQKLEFLGSMLNRVGN